MTLRALPPVVAAVALSLLFTAGASGEEIVLPEDFSAADQYVESVPTGKGPRPGARQEPGAGKGTPLPPSISGRLVGETGSQLEQVATSPELGAPAKRLARVTDDATPSVPSATVSAIDEGGTGVWLLLGLLLVTGVVAGTAGHRHHNKRKTAAGG